jgi:hypothetical protein
MAETLTERIHTRFEAAQQRLRDNPKSRTASYSMAILAEAGKYAARSEYYRERRENMTRPADRLTDSQRTAIDALKSETPGTIAKRLGLCKEYVSDYLKQF